MSAKTYHAGITQEIMKSNSQRRHTRRCDSFIIIIIIIIILIIIIIILLLFGACAGIMRNNLAELKRWKCVISAFGQPRDSASALWVSIDYWEGVRKSSVSEYY